ncbi:hypothetical protein U9M48_036869 [Paspalum notatum var. saurae]|uniref:Uncharacterized protein n=1 Tax=Paspalum notatum var. saurae TaxID=547442 RepID=A0AAQ3XBQ3_PASNO
MDGPHAPCMGPAGLPQAAVETDDAPTFCISSSVEASEPLLAACARAVTRRCSPPRSLVQAPESPEPLRHG